MCLVVVIVQIHDSNQSLHDCFWLFHNISRVMYDITVLKNNKGCPVAKQFSHFSNRRHDLNHEHEKIITVLLQSHRHRRRGKRESAPQTNPQKTGKRFSG